MADTVRYLLEEMVPELDAMVQRGYFSRAEIRSIVQRRQDFEYNLKRMAAVQDDYIRYIDYEMKLEELRVARRASCSISGKKGLAEYCIVRRIHFIYQRMLQKFRGDLALWSRWLSFCQQTGSSRQMSRVLAKALRLHSGCPSLWTFAAAWEMEHNLNVAAARALMQRGLRMCKHCPQLWHEYFRMELLYALRLAERRRVLGIDGGGGGDGGAAKAAAAEEGDAAPRADGEGDQQPDAAAAAIAAVLSGAVALVVFRKAAAAVPGDLPFQAKFLDILQGLPHFQGRTALEDAVYNSVAADFASSPQAWDLRARRLVLKLPPRPRAAELRGALTAALAVYEEGLRAAPCPALLQLLLSFLEEQAAALDAATSASDGSAAWPQPALSTAAANSTASGDAVAAGGCPSKKRKRPQQAQEEAAALHAAADWLRQCTAACFEGGQAQGLLTQQMWLAWVSFHLHSHELEAAVEVCRSALAAAPSAARIWQQLLVLEGVRAAVAAAEGGDCPETAAVPLQQRRRLRQHSNAPQPATPTSSNSEGHAALSLGSRQRMLPQLVATVPPTDADATVDHVSSAQLALEELALQALRCVAADEALSVWLTATSLLTSVGCCLDSLCQEMVQAALRQSKGPVEGGLGAAAAALLTALHEAGGGMEAVRKLYRALLAGPPPGGDFFRCLLKLECRTQQEQPPPAQRQQPRKQPPGVVTEPSTQPLPAQQLQDLFEVAVAAYGQDDVQLWLQYAAWRQAQQGAAGAAAVHWKACKALRHPESFVAAYQAHAHRQPGT